MIRIVLFLFLVWPLAGLAQSRTVLPAELELTVTLDPRPAPPFTREMVLLTIRGVYRRHITREQVIQPDFDGFSWSQLGEDLWQDERIDGQKVKTFSRRMAIYPDRAGDLTIGAFTHRLTLTDESDAWFEHDILSKPVTLHVEPAPENAGWWFPVRRLRISDQWSNAPDQLQPGEGVLRVIRIEALGVTPEMIPPMPELTSPSAMIFAHPDQRFVELSPEGPLTYAFWRWTIRPTNDTSAVVEPMSFSYFDTTTRETHTVTISAQRVAYGADGAPDPSLPAATTTPPAESRLPGWEMAGLAFLVFVMGLILSIRGRQITGAKALQRFSFFDPLARDLRKAARTRDLAALRRAARAILSRDGPSGPRQQLLAELDRSVFDPTSESGPPDSFARRFVQAGRSDIRPADQTIAGP